MDLEPRSKAEAWVLRMGRRSVSKGGSWLWAALIYSLSTVFMVFAGGRFLKTFPEQFTYILIIGFLWTWTVCWAGFALLWFERRTFYRILERLRRDAEEE